LADGTIVDAEICVIGAGAAGITLALELANEPYRIALIESGGFEPEEQTDALHSAVNIGHKYPNLPASRLRYFGGSTNHWGGHCAPMSPLNFERRPWIAHSGWPFSRRDLDPYYLRAHDVLLLGEFDYNAESVARVLRKNLFPFDPSRVETVVSRYNPLAFGRHYRDILDRMKNLTTYLWGNVVSINRHPTNAYVRDVYVRTLTGKSFTVRGRYFVLAAGGIENARILLLSNDVDAAGLGNECDQVGRYFMEHIWYPSGIIVPADPRIVLDIYGHRHALGNIRIGGDIALPERLVRELEIPDFRAELAVLRAVTDKGIGVDVMNIVSELEAVASPFRRGVQLPLVYWLLNFVEQVPNPGSRIGLARERDALGLHRVTVHWQLSELDRTGIRKANEVIAAEVGRSGFGRMRIELPSNEETILDAADGGPHQMGATRMHENPRRGVVDANCRIHGLHNIYVAGSSVFPTVGHSNPTLTIVAMTIRLADHLKKLMKS
jgi:choline dehydrogenase-like flavoprotein